MSEYPVIAWLARMLHAGGRKSAHWAINGIGFMAIAMAAIALGTGSAAAENRSLKLFFTHTGERATITYKRDGKFDPKGLAQINRFLRDWRRNEPARMDPRLLDLVWEVYQRSGAKDYINIVSAYRSPATNKMLRGRSRNTGVAKNSQHTLGKAMDFYIPGVKLAKLRALAMQMQVGGVGYYPTSGSPFVHLDVGGVRAWPRMSRQELVRIFPNGKTLHVPADGRPLPGFNVAMADYKRRVGSKSIRAASTVGAFAGAEDAKLARSSLTTALLPTRKSRAEQALEMQTAAQEIGENPAYFDLSTISPPLPSFRPAAIEPVVPPGMSAFIPTSTFKSMGGLSITGRVMRQPSVSVAGLAEIGEKEGRIPWSISDKTLLTWALAPAEALARLTLPSGLQRAVAAADGPQTVGQAMRKGQPSAFKTDRFPSGA